MLWVAVFALMKPPVIFSSGLFGGMPASMYSNVLNDIRTNFTVVDAPIACSRRDYDTLCDKLNMDKVPFIAHSSINLDVLKSRRMRSAFLIDPASVPALSFNGLEQANVESPCPIRVVQSKLYESFVPTKFQPRFSEVICEIFDGAGHSDVLDSPWAATGEFAGIPSEADMRIEYRDFIKRSIRKWLLDKSDV